MAALQTSDVLRVVLICNSAGQYSQNVVHYLVVTQSGGFTDQECADALSQEWSSPLRDLMAPNASYVGLKLQRLAPNPTQPVVSTGGAGVGSRTGDLMSPQTCGLLAKKTDTGGKKGRGRMYLPFPSEADNTSTGIVGATYITNAAAVSANLSTNLSLTGAGTSGQVRGILYNPAHGFSAVKLITSTVLNGAWGTQRRRSFVNRGDRNPL